MEHLKKLWKNKIIAFLSIFLFSLVFLKWILQPKPPTTLPTPELTPFPSPTFWPRPTPTLRATVPPLSQKVLEKIIAQLPFKSESFEIEYYQKTKKFAVIITRGPINQTIKKVENWFKSQGVQDLTQIDILYQPTREVLNEAEVQRPIPEP